MIVPVSLLLIFASYIVMTITLFRRNQTLKGLMSIQEKIIATQNETIATLEKTIHIQKSNLGALNEMVELLSSLWVNQ